jgi:hypothetical protein
MSFGFEIFRWTAQRLEHYQARQPKAEAMELAPEALKYLIVSCQKGPIVKRDTFR